MHVTVIFPCVSVPSEKVQKDVQICVIRSQSYRRRDTGLIGTDVLHVAERLDGRELPHDGVLLCQTTNA
jgi:hypothetical protein